MNNDFEQDTQFTTVDATRHAFTLSDRWNVGPIPNGGYLMAAADYGDFGRAEPVAVIDTIGVDPNFSHSGVGRALLSQLFINLGALRVERVESVVAKEHFDLLGFFYRAGFGPSQRLAFVKNLA